ncbi:MAG: ribosomal protein S18-alanine N-acetyltransferase [Halieaceae bacterium]|nr:ribosomal protein S18-alanine N-acetyltransferase [Halieaceae bacterium]
MQDVPRLRPGQAADLKPIAALEQLAAVAPWTLSQFAGLVVKPATHSLVLEGDNALLGFALFQRVLDEATLLNIAVRPDAQGRGLGRRLLQGVIDCLTEQGVGRLLLEVREGNSVALGLYRKLGFTEDGMRRDYYPGSHPGSYPNKNGRENAVLMSLTLESR